MTLQNRIYVVIYTVNTIREESCSFFFSFKLEFEDAIKRSISFLVLPGDRHKLLQIEQQNICTCWHFLSHSPSGWRCDEFREKTLQPPPQLLEATTVPLLGSLSQTESLGRDKSKYSEDQRDHEGGEELGEQIKAELRTQIEGMFLLFFVRG